MSCLAVTNTYLFNSCLILFNHNRAELLYKKTNANRIVTFPIDINKK